VQFAGFFFLFLYQLIYMPSRQANIIHKCEFTFLGIINNSANSLFDYHQPGESWSTYYDPDFTPLFGVEFSDPVLENEAMELCQGDEFCLYDIATTGSMDIGLSTLNGSVSYEEIVETSKPGLKFNCYTV